MQKVNIGGLTEILKGNLCEVFIRERRIPVRNRPIFRRMLCTNADVLLKSLHGITRIGYRYPKVPASPAMMRWRWENNIICTWDILMQDHRYINLDDTYLVKGYSVTEKNERVWMKKDKFVHPVSRMEIKVSTKHNFMGGLRFIQEYILNGAYLQLAESERYYWMDSN